MFTYKDYYELLTQILNDKETMMFLRHDVDISPMKALELATREANMHVGPATYFIHTCSEWYNPFDSESGEYIRRILELGHHIGLHYDTNIMGNTDKEILSSIVWHANFLAEHFDTKVKSVSQHMPKRNIINYDVLTQLQTVDLNDPMITMKNYKYLSDSGMMFLEDPFKVADNHKRIHLNLHPEWWADKEGTVEDRLYDLELDKKIDRKVYKRLQGIREHNERAKNAYNRSPQVRNDEPTEIL